MNNRLALVIGNANYQKVNSLVNPINDANDIASILQRLGFDVVCRTDCSQDELQTYISDFTKKLEDYSTGLLYYAGHGMQIDGKNYIVPIDCEATTKERTILSCYCLDDFFTRISVYKGKTNICILDACRTNPFVGLSRGITAGFTEFSNQPGEQ